MKEFIRLETAVKYIRKTSEGKYEVTSRHLPTMKDRTEQFDYVIVAAGHYNTPNMPHYAGIENAKKMRVFHS